VIPKTKQQHHEHPSTGWNWAKQQHHRRGKKRNYQDEAWELGGRWKGFLSGRQPSGWNELRWR
jgi:hypothetical protein